jgi:hypothetical protein
MDEQEIRETLLQKAYIDLASDGSYDQDTGIMAYGWVISINQIIMVTGKGPAKGHASMADSLRAEAYGLTAGALALDTIRIHFAIEPQEHIWTILLDSTSLIKQMENLQETTLNPKGIYNPHANIIRMAHCLLKPYTPEYVHVKSHQKDNKTTSGLSFDAKLNIMADDLANNQRSEMSQTRQDVTTDSAQLLINDVTITKDHQRSILESSSSIPIRQYYNKKYKWHGNTFDTINWAAQHKVLKRYDNNDQRRILKFVHGWIPTYDRLYREQQAPSPQCPLCNNLIEDNLHLFMCTHPQQQEVVATLHRRMESDNNNYGVDELLIIYKEAISQIGHKWTPPTLSKDKELNDCVQDQTRIGWQQILFGRISCKITSYIETNLRSKGVEKWKNTGEKWTTRMIQNIWDTLLTLWSHRNNLIFNNQETAKSEVLRQRLRTKVDRYYQYAEKLTVTDRQKLFQKEKEELISEDPRYINAWLKLAARIIRASKRETSKLMYREQTLMEKFFNWNPVNRPRTRKKTKRKSFKEDLKPD